MRWHCLYPDGGESIGEYIPGSIWFDVLADGIEEWLDIQDETGS